MPLALTTICPVLAELVSINATGHGRRGRGLIDDPLDGPSPNPSPPEMTDVDPLCRRELLTPDDWTGAMK